MKHLNYIDLEPEIPTEEGIKDVNIRWLISEKDGAKNFAMRLFEVQPGGHTPWHNHEWEHEMFVLQGKGVARSEDGEIKFKHGDAFFVEPWEWHNFINTGQDIVKFLCMIPYLKKR